MRQQQRQRLDGASSLSDVRDSADANPDVCVRIAKKHLSCRLVALPLSHRSYLLPLCAKVWPTHAKRLYGLASPPPPVLRRSASASAALLAPGLIVRLSPYDLHAVAREAPLLTNCQPLEGALSGRPFALQRLPLLYLIPASVNLGPSFLREAV